MVYVNALFVPWLFICLLLKMDLLLQGTVHMCESFQDYSWIQDFEAYFPQKVSLKILN